MACPYFYPQERLEEKAKSPRLPLGDPYGGVCRVDALREWRPDHATLRDLCNLGYARQKCPRFPSGNGPDALRFSMLADQDGVLKIFYVCEKNHAPAEHGTIEYSSASAEFLAAPESDMLRRQARAYADSYLRRQQQPENEARNPHRR